jgi:hypothetical protein
MAVTTVAELDLVRVCERDVLEGDTGADGQIAGRADALDERGEPGDVIGLDMRLEHRHDRRSDRGRDSQVVVDEVDVRVDDCQL